MPSETRNKTDRANRKGRGTIGRVSLRQEANSGCADFDFADERGGGAHLAGGAVAIEQDLAVRAGLVLEAVNWPIPCASGRFASLLRFPYVIAISVQRPREINFLRRYARARPRAHSGGPRANAVRPPARTAEPACVAPRGFYGRVSKRSRRDDVGGALRYRGDTGSRESTRSGFS